MRAPDPCREGAQIEDGCRMTLSRRRFLAISAAFAAMPAGAAQAHSWEGFAFGAQVSLRMQGPKAQALTALNEARVLIAKLEELFSLYNPNSTLSVLNRTGTLTAPDALFMDLIRAADTAFTQSGGLFDPTVQALWSAVSHGQDTTPAIAAMGWEKVQVVADRITLGPAQTLTLNGIAQGYATDLIADMLITHGFTDTLVNIGEFRGAGGPFTLGLSDPLHGVMGQRTLSGGAIATSSPAATMLGEQGHILHPSARAKWSTVSVEATRATVADSLSTAMVLAPRSQVQAIKERADITRVTLVDFAGNLTTL